MQQEFLTPNCLTAVTTERLFSPQIRLLEQIILGGKPGVHLHVKGTGAQFYYENQIPNPSALILGSRHTV